MDLYLNKGGLTMAKEKENKHEGLTIIIRRELQEYEKEELKEIIKNYEHSDDTTTIGFF